MKYYSLNRQSRDVSFREATVEGQAPDKGLYFPRSIPALDNSFINNIEAFSNEEIAFEVLKPYMAGEISDKDLLKIIEETVHFPIPLKALTNNIYTLELFHGNTLAFKDIGARFMSRCLRHFVHGGNKKITVLVATSGDTGGAVADGFFDIEGVEVVILYPSGKVSTVQEQQLTTYGKNIHAVEINGTFDDCQKLVKEAFSDQHLNRILTLTSANSINVARWLPQQIFYFLAYKQWHKKEPLVISVPSGNLGNICAGLLAKKSGLPIHHFIAACNANDVVTRYLDSSIYNPVRSVSTISNAMDVGDPSNFIRVLELFDQQYETLKKHLSSYSISDEASKKAMLKVYNENGYLLDPHGAVGFAALQQYLDLQGSGQGVFFETAHPIKFIDVVEDIVKIDVAMPGSIESIMNKSKNATYMNPNLDEFKDFLQSIS